MASTRSRVATPEEVLRLAVDGCRCRRGKPWALSCSYEISVARAVRCPNHPVSSSPASRTCSRRSLTHGWPGPGTARHKHVRLAAASGRPRGLPGCRQPTTAAACLALHLRLGLPARDGCPAASRLGLERNPALASGRAVASRPRTSEEVAMGRTG